MLEKVLQIEIFDPYGEVISMSYNGKGAQIPFQLIRPDSEQTGQADTVFMLHGRSHGHSNYLADPIFKAFGMTTSWDSANHVMTVTEPSGKVTTISAGGPAASKEQLRLQVRDFLAWLKAAGII